MKRIKLAAPHLSIGLTLGLALGMALPAQDAQDEDGKDQTGAGAAKLVELEQRVQMLEQYLQKQAKAAETMSTAMDAVEKAGFTFGINPASRELMLSAIRAQSTEAAKSVPGAKQEKKGRGR